MRKLVSSKHLESISDLTLTAPIRQGFVDAFESVTYETRLRMILKALFKMRATAREYSQLQPFVDTSARIHSLLDYRIAILDDTEPKRLILSATFDRPFEPYMRLIWNPLGPLLDVIFCNCERYVTATEHGFPDYLAWVRNAQIDTNFFYAASGHSVDDLQYLLRIEQLQREARGRYSATAVTIPDVERNSEAVRTHKRLETNRLGVEALAALYRLTDVYPPDHPEGDGKYLRWATQHLLMGWDTSALVPPSPGAMPPFTPEQKLGMGIAEQLAWLVKDEPPQTFGETRSEALRYDPSHVQGGILDNYGKGAPGRCGKPVRHGAMLLMRITDPEKARQFLGRLDVDAGDDAGVREGVYLNVAFTRHGLDTIGVSEAELARFPQEFLEGMEARAGLLGDVREHHPRNWKLPLRNWPQEPPDRASAERVELPEVDIVIQLRTTADHACEYRVGDTSHPLHKKIAELGGDSKSGVRLLAVEAMSRLPELDGDRQLREHFGFADGISQPAFARGQTPVNGELPLGDVLLGYPNSRTDPAPAENTLLDNGTFLVVRKLRQHVGDLNAFVEKYANTVEDRTAEREGETGARPARDHMLAKMLGRYPDGTPLVPLNASGGANDFDYEKDIQGTQCPFQAHIRRVNPRTKPREALDERGLRTAVMNRDGSQPTPRILRRGMTYGPPFANDPEAERGVMFMAYSASIAEQFETIQRWINGGNPTGVASWQNDPIAGIAGLEGPSVFRFRDGREVRRVQPGRFVSLEWGAYLFVPSMAAIRKLAQAHAGPEVLRQANERAAADQGEIFVAQWQERAETGAVGRAAAAAAWKTCIEDFSSRDPGEKNAAQPVWAAIRRHHGGAIRVPYGLPDAPPRDAVLVASKELVMRVFRNRDGDYSMCGQMERMERSFGPIFLGLDDTLEYDAVAGKINPPIWAISEQEAFAVARAIAMGWLVFVDAQLSGAFESGIELDLRRDYISRVLSGICNHWFGIPDGFGVEVPGLDVKDVCDPVNVDAGGWSWEPLESRKPRCPGDYMATSRYCFYPDPHPRVAQYGQEQGQALREAVREHFRHLRAKGQTPQAKLAKIMASALPDDDTLARTLIGVMTGFLPPADGSLRWTLYDWLEEKTLWRVQDALRAAASDPRRPTDPIQEPYWCANEAIRKPLILAMQKRPAPDMLWRTAKRAHRIGTIDVAAGDRIFIGIVSAMAEDVTSGVHDVAPVFGGDREGADHPLHACPAQKFAMGTMLGMLSALLECGRIEALPSPMLVKLTLRQAAPTAGTAAQQGARAAPRPASESAGIPR